MYITCRLEIIIIIIRFCFTFQSTSQILHLLQAMQVQNVTREEKIERMESRILNAISNQMSTENHHGSNTLAQEETEVKTSKEGKHFQKILFYKETL